MPKAATAEKRTLTLEEMVQECAEAEEQAKNLYARKDELLAKIAKEASPGDILKATDGRRFLFINNWIKAGKNKKYPNPTMWAHAGARKWELEAVKP